MNAAHTPTPRTDAEAHLMSLDCDDSCVEIYIKRDGKTIEGDFVSADFARQLERELAEATKQRDALATALCQVLDNDGVLVRTAAREALATLEGSVSNPAQKSPTPTP
jgi:hypothetical protein